MDINHETIRLLKLLGYNAEAEKEADEQKNHSGIIEKIYNQIDHLSEKIEWSNDNE